MLLAATEALLSNAIAMCKAVSMSTHPVGEESAMAESIDSDRLHRVRETELFLQACADEPSARGGRARDTAFAKVCGDLKYLAQQSAADWTPEFRKVLAHATSMRVSVPPSPLTKVSTVHSNLYKPHKTYTFYTLVSRTHRVGTFWHSRHLAR